MSKEKRLQRQIAKTLINEAWDQCDVNQVLDNFKIRLQRAASDEEKEEIIKEYSEMYNIETTKL